MIKLLVLLSSSFSKTVRELPWVTLSPIDKPPIKWYNVIAASEVAKMNREPVSPEERCLS